MRCDGCQLNEDEHEIRVDDEGYRLCRDCQGQVADSLAQLERVEKRRQRRNGGKR